MTEHEFTLVIDGDLADETSARALFEAGCDDATFGVVDGVGYGEFLREAPSFAAAVLSAVDQVESIQGLQVMRVEPDDIVTMAEIGDRLDRTRESVRLLIAGQRGPGGPASDVTLEGARPTLALVRRR
jgi:hypothetical protein